MHPKCPCSFKAPAVLRAFPRPLLILRPQWLCVHSTSSAAISSFRSLLIHSLAMDAVTVAAALAIVVDESQQAAMREVLLERERLAMALADRDSYLAQRHYVGSLQVPRPDRPMTWETAFNRRHNDLIDAHAAMRAAARALRSGDDEAALSCLTAEVGDENSEQSSADEDEEMESAAASEEEEEEDMEEDVEVSPQGTCALKNSPISMRAARVHARTSSSGSAAEVGLCVDILCTFSRCLPYSIKCAQHWGGLHRHFGSGTQLPTPVQMLVRFHLFMPYLQ